MSRRLLTILALASALWFTAGAVQARAQDGAVALQKADGETLSAGIGHFARARSLLLAAIREFDLGLAKVNPDMLLDSAKWRETLMERAGEIERVLDPQPRASKGGVRYEPDSRLLTEAIKK